MAMERGIPMQLRMGVYMRVTGAYQEMGENPGLYAGLCKQQAKRAGTPKPHDPCTVGGALLSDLGIIGTASSLPFQWSESRPPGPRISIFRAVFVSSPIPGTPKFTKTLKSRPKSEISLLRASLG